MGGSKERPTQLQQNCLLGKSNQPETFQTQPNFILAGFTTKLCTIHPELYCLHIVQIFTHCGKLWLQPQINSEPLCGTVSAIFLSELWHYFLSPALDKDCRKIFQCIRIGKGQKEERKLHKSTPLFSLFVIKSCCGKNHNKVISFWILDII